MSLLTVEGLERTFDGPVPVRALAEATFTIDRGEFVAVVGRSGSGKSTLLAILGLLDRPSAGRYLVAGRDTVPIGRRERDRLRAATFGFVFQDDYLIGYRTIDDNVALADVYAGGPRADRAARVEAALRRVQLGHRLGFHPAALSGGERQRVSIARALVKRPPVLLADEPTGNLDETTSREVVELLHELRDDGLTVIMVTHDMAIAATADRRIRLLDGIATVDG